MSEALEQRSPAPSDTPPSLAAQVGLTERSHPNGAGTAAATPHGGDAPAAGPAQGGTFAAMRHRDYRFLWVGTVFMSAGQWIQQVTLGWLVYDLTGSSVLLGALQTVRALPFLLLSPGAGVAADRFDRRMLMLWTQLVLATTAFAMGLLVSAGLVEVWHMFVFSVITATAWAFNQPLRQTLLPAVVPREDMMNAVALSSVAFNMTKVLGPALGGFLIAAFGAGGNFFVQTGAYVGVLVSIFCMHVPAAEAVARRTSALSNLKEGLAYCARTPLVRALLIAGLIPSVVANPYATLLPVFQKDIFHVDPSGLGLMLAAPGIGAVASTFGLASLAHRVNHKGWILVGALATMGFFIFLFARTDTLSVALLTLVGVGGAQILYNATTTSMIQLVVPDALRGRVMSIYMMDFGFSPVGSMIVGICAEHFGAPVTVAVQGLVVVLLAIGIWFVMPQIRESEV